MKPSFILEGPNGSGKSTLGKKLSEVYGLPYVHAGPDPGSTLNAIEASADQLAMLKKGVILDRCTPISRLVYQENLIDYDKIPLSGFMQVMQRYAVVIYCTADKGFTEKSYYPQGHFEEIVKDKERIRKMYGHVMSYCRHIVYDCNVTPIEELIEEIRNARV